MGPDRKQARELEQARWGSGQLRTRIRRHAIYRRLKTWTHISEFSSDSLRSWGRVVKRWMSLTEDPLIYLHDILLRLKELPLPWVLTVIHGSRHGTFPSLQETTEKHRLIIGTFKAWNIIPIQEPWLTIHWRYSKSLSLWITTPLLLLSDAAYY